MPASSWVSAWAPSSPKANCRRYPLTARERRITRHLIGIADPFWYLFLALDLGLALGLYGFGAGSFWFGLTGVLLLFLCNYICARVLGMLVERLMMRKGGAMLLMIFVISLGLLPQLLQPLFHKGAWSVIVVKRIWNSLPTTGAAAAMTRTGTEAFAGLALVLRLAAGLRPGAGSAGTPAAGKSKPSPP